MSENNELLRRYVAERSEEAFTLLVRRNLNLVYSAALRRTGGDAHLAQDVAQSVFIALATEAEHLQQHEVLAGWLYTATRHAAANALRGELRRKFREQEAYAMPKDRSTAEEWNELRPELDSVMDELGAPDRNALLLRFFEDRPFAEIGRALQVSEDAARVRVNRALEKLRVRLESRGISSTAGALAGVLATHAVSAAPPGLGENIVSQAFASTLMPAAASAASAATMTATAKIALASASVATLLAIGAAVTYYHAAETAKHALAAANTERQSLLQQLAEKHRPTAELPQDPDSTAATTRDAAEGARSGRGDTRGIIANTLDVLMADPRYQQVSVRNHTLTLHLRYAALYRKLAMTTAEIAEFERLKLQEWQATNDLMIAARSQGISVVDPSLVALLKPMQQTLRNRLVDLLGDSGYAAYAAFDRTASARSTVETLALGLLYSRTPLDAAQADALTDLIASHTTTLPESRGLLGAPRQTDWDAILAAAGRVLSRPQLEMFETVAAKTKVSKDLSDLSDSILSAAASHPSGSDSSTTRAAPP